MDDHKLKKNQDRPRIHNRISSGIRELNPN